MSFNISLAKLSEDELKHLIENGKRISELDGFDFENAILFSYGFIKEIVPNLIKNGNFEKLICSAFNDRGLAYQEKEISFIDHNKLLQFVLWIKDEIESINELEKTYLVSDPDIDMISAGINELNQFGILNTIDQLAGGDILKWNEVKKLKYSDVFDKLYKSTIESRVQKKLNQIMVLKNKSK